MLTYVCGWLVNTNQNIKCSIYYRKTLHKSRKLLTRSIQTEEGDEIDAINICKRGRTCFHKKGRR